MGEFSKITINNHVYKVDKFSVMDATLFHLDFLSKFGGFLAGLTSIVTSKREIKENDFILLFGSIDPEKSQEIIFKILKRVITPENVRLDNELVIQEWFSKPENSHDYWLVVSSAAIELLGEQLPATLSSAIAGLKSTVANMLTSPMDIKQSASSQGR